MPQRYLVTSALPYANGPQHVGHLAGAYLSADIYVRYLRMIGKEVLFVCGSDEYGAAITMMAKKENTTPRQIVDKYHDILRQCFEQIGISFDIYHRTSSELHNQTAADFFLTLHQKGVFEEKTSEQFYDEAAGMFLADRYIIGTCPKCAFENAYGDQCERCGTSLSPTDLLMPRSTLSGQTPVLKPTKHWYLPMGRYQKWVEQWIENTQQNEAWKEPVLRACQAWLQQGLADRSMTRDLDWGVPVPLPDAAGKVLYVWLDAPIGYISATKAAGEQKGFDWKKYWQDPETKLVHFIGKDNIVFHCIIFPMLLHAHGEYILPKNIPANQFMNLEGEKMSTSRNYAVWVPDLLRDFVGMEDVIRYVLIANMPEQKDSSFVWKDFQQRNNSELVAILGNFVHRVLTLIEKYYNGVLPYFDLETLAGLPDSVVDAQEALKQLPILMDKYINFYEFRNGLIAVIDTARAGNKFLADAEPWKTIKNNPPQTAAILALSLEIAAYLAVFMQPFLPFTALKLSRMIGLKPEQTADILEGKRVIRSGHIIEKPELLFRKIEDAEIQPYIDRLEAIRQARTAEQTAAQQQNSENGQTEQAKHFVPLKPEIMYDDFAKLDIRTALILAAERVPKADKLLKLTLDLGFEQRTVVSGIAQHYVPEDIIGRRVLVLANLAVRKMRGIDSNGMILMAEEDGHLVFVAPDGQIGNGCPVA